MNLHLTYNKKIYLSCKSNILYIDDKLIWYKNDKGDELKLEKQLKHTSFVHSLNNPEVGEELSEQLWYSIYNRIAVNQLSYISFYLLEVENIFLKNNYSKLVLNEPVPKNFSLPIAFALGDISKVWKWERSVMNYFIFNAFSNKYTIDAKFRINYSNILRKYLIFIFKLIFVMIFSLTSRKVSAGKKFLVTRDNRTLEQVTEKEIDTYLLIPSYRIFKDYFKLNKSGKIIFCYRPAQALKGLFSLFKGDSGGFVRISDDLVVSKKELICAYVLEEFDKFSIFVGLKKLELSNTSLVITPDFSSEYAFFQRLSLSNVSLRFEQTYALSSDRIKYIPNFNELLVNDKKIAESLSSFLQPNQKINIKKIKFKEVQFFSELNCVGLITQPNFSVNDGLYELLKDLICYLKRDGINFVIKIHPRDSGDYTEFEEFIDNCNAAEFIEKCDVLVGKSSYMLYEGLIAGKVYFNESLENTNLAYLNNKETNFNGSEELISKIENVRSYFSFFKQLQKRFFD